MKLRAFPAPFAKALPAAGPGGALADHPGKEPSRPSMGIIKWCLRKSISFLTGLRNGRRLLDTMVNRLIRSLAVWKWPCLTGLLHSCFAAQELDGTTRTTPSGGDATSGGVLPYPAHEEPVARPPRALLALEHGLQGAKTLREQETIGMSRGGMTAKLLAAVDEEGPPLRLRPDLRRSP